MPSKICMCVYVHVSLMLSIVVLFQTEVFHTQASGSQLSLNYHLGNDNPYTKDRKKKGFNEGTNLVENDSAAHSQKVHVSSSLSIEW